MRTANPALKADTFQGYLDHSRENAMTLQGTVIKTGVLLVCVFVAASYVWSLFYNAAGGFEEKVGTVMPWFWGGMLGGLVFALVTIFKKSWAPLTAPLYGILEGLFLGALSAIFEARFPGIVIQAITLTFGTCFCLLIAYASRLIKPSENFKLGIAAATGAILLVYFVSFVMGFFGRSLGFIHDSGPIGIGFSVVVVIIAALNLVLDFDFIEEGSSKGAPGYMEWYAAFGLMVTLVWLYIEILRLLSKLRQR